MPNNYDIDQDEPSSKSNSLEQGGSYGQIVKSSSVMAGSASVTMFMALARIKFAALFMGSGGVGLLATLTNLQTLISTIAGLGLQTSAVREIAAASGKDDLASAALQVQVLRKISILTGISGMAFTFVFGGFISLVTFGTMSYTFDVCLLGVAVFLLNVSGAHLATIQGMRKITSLAKVNALSALFATALTLSLYYFFGARAIAPSLVGVATCQFLFAFLFVKKIELIVPNISWKDAINNAGPMIKLGFALMWSSVIAQLSTYLLTAYITLTQGLESTGIYSAALMLSGASVGFVLLAMSADYYPRLASLSMQRNNMRALINQQTEIGLLLSVPCLIAIMAFADVAMIVFYSEDLVRGASLLIWFVLGGFIRVITWPLGFAVLALGRKKMYALIETLFNLGSLFIIISAIHFFGLEAGAISYVMCYLFYGVAIYLVVHNLVDMNWSRAVVKLIVLHSMILFFLLSSVLLLPSRIVWALGVVLIVLMGIISAKGLLDRLGSDHRISRVILKIPGVHFLKNNLGWKI